VFGDTPSGLDYAVFHRRLKGRFLRVVFTWLLAGMTGGIFCLQNVPPVKRLLMAVLETDD
jgi:hypothetical protein